MSNLSAIGQRVRRRMLELNISTIKELEQRAGITKDSIRHLLSGRTTSIRSGKLPALASALEMSLDELVHGHKTANGTESVTMSLCTQEHPDNALGKLRVDLAVCQRFGVSDGEPIWLVSQSDNMAPTISAGDVVLVDVSVHKADSDGIYCIASNVGVFTFRRIQISAVGGLLSIANDNPKYLPETSIDPSALQIAGKVLGTFRRI